MQQGVASAEELNGLLDAQVRRDEFGSAEALVAAGDGLRVGLIGRVVFYVNQSELRPAPPGARHERRDGYGGEGDHRKDQKQYLR
jgi:hypothetical protein